MRSEVDPLDTKAAAYVSLGISIVLNAAALIFLRALVGAISSPGDTVTLSFFVAALSSRLLWAGGGCFVAAVFFWVHSLKHIPLSVAYPTAATSYVFIAFFARYLFHEPITATRGLGMIMIIAGVGLLYRRRAEEAG